MNREILGNSAPRRSNTQRDELARTSRAVTAARPIGGNGPAGSYPPESRRVTSQCRRLHYSVGMTITEDIAHAILQLPDRIWEPAYDAGGQVRPSTWVAEITGLLDLTGWPAGMRIIVRKERPHPGARYSSPTLAGTG
jgi:hypothetical protein